MKEHTAIPRTGVIRKTTGTQYAALPYRVREKGIEILLITSLRTHRWIIPKGWPKEGHGPWACAELEALEEAGVDGEIEKTALGHYHYVKQIRDGIGVPCRVEVFALRVTRERKAWAEKNERKRRWCTIDEAIAAVEEPDLRTIIEKFRTPATAPH